MKPQINNYRILVVDSSLIIIERLYQLLKEMTCIGCVSKAYNYTEALEKMSIEDFDIVLLDSQLPGKNGFELLSFIKEHYPKTKTIMLTNQSSEFYRNKGAKIGADHFIDKSDEFERVAQIINEYSVGYQMN
jgi:DNA-binding NarL/FixJ family response regulator